MNPYHIDDYPKICSQCKEEKYIRYYKHVCKDCEEKQNEKHTQSRSNTGKPETPH